jgi:hypothetical protein
MGDFGTFDSVFFVTIGGMVFGFLGLSVRYCFRSKCTSVKCCGIEVIRDAITEEKMDEYNLTHGGNRGSSKETV